jgi:general secretion pathway protein E
MLLTAAKGRGTDIHLEPKTDITQVRMRVDGQMVWIADIPKRVGDLTSGLVRTACQLKSVAADAVQDGHFSARFPDRRVEYRASFTPTMQGAKLVLRVLDERGIPHSIGELGLAPYMEERVRKTCEQSQGMLLVCGPTGSGKTTTLYNCLRAVDREKKNVITIEDPVEYQIEGCTQIPINEKRGNTFFSLLRSCLRQDPDVILLGEIRDDETAQTAMRAAMTGHLVFTTLHAKDTISAVFRLLDLKVEPFLVANSLELILAQRLLRVLCDNCKRTVPVTPGQATRIGRFLGGKSQVYSAVGCQSCLKTGYRGRRALFELASPADNRTYDPHRKGWEHENPHRSAGARRRRVRFRL